MFTITPSQSQSSSSSASASSSQQQLLQQQQQQLLKQQQAIIQQAMLQQQAAALYHPALIAAMSQIEPMPNGNLPPRFDPTSCRSVYVGNIHPNVSEGLLAEVFATVGPLAGCKLIRKEKSSYGFVDYYDHRLAAAAIFTLNGKHIFSQAIKVNWAYASGQREDTTGHFSIFVGDLSSDVTDAALYAFFSIYQSCSDARVMWDQRTGRSRGFGFVSFRSQQDAERAIIEMTGKCLGSRAIRCNWATKSGTGSTNQAEEASAAANSSMNLDVDVPSLLSNTVSRTNEMQQEAEPASKDAPENNPLCTTVYVGNLAHDITQTELHRHFHALGAGVIEEVRVQREKGFGFVRYRTHAEAAIAIQAANGKIIGGKSVKCSWGTKPTPPGTSSAPLPPPAPLPYQSLVAGGGLSQGYSAADLYAIQRQLALGAGALLPLPSQGMNMGLTGMSVGSRSGYDSLQTGGGLGQAQML